MRAFICLIALAAPVLLAPVSLGADLSPAGRWVTIDDKTGTPRSVIEIEDVAGTLQGKVLKIYDRPGDNPGHLCRNCSGDLKDKPVIGMTLIQGLTRDGDTWDGGTILDPDTGNTYSAEMHLLDNGQKLEVRGYFGISLLGRSQTWVRQTTVN
jgi:uncharacterized protein (DUF2147 family)